ncbi:DUF2306 domain-containing protein [Parvularcula sp. LCG005]|uniref:DUF2306 domain-containing protein n=1 Tax=Parvularcula sp. LCG005 TaxID=3078805 RepID=UPI002943A5A3|nr:DUF2306 domain-containing protein [Parvularcula sp. LCG005]WOI54772.1 DUF2306 domain-containing protein [Parvularcula sp. LCG005]
MTERHPQTRRADLFLKGTGIFWYIVAAIGQAIFIYYIFAFYGEATVQNDLGSLNEKDVITGIVDGDETGNFLFITHALGAAVITLGGLLQLIPAIRRYAPAFHRWNGRIFMLMAYMMALGGLMMVWVRGSYTSMAGAVGITGNALCIILFATIALRLAMRRRINEHRKWAMRLFLAANGVWFIRVFVMAWIIINQSPRWLGDGLEGPAGVAISFAAFFLPVAVLQLYFAAQDSRSAAPKYIMGGGLILGTLIMAMGIFGATLFMWGPHF